MWFPVSILLFAQVSPGPLDAFRANYAAIKAEAEFTCVEGNFEDAHEKVWSAVNFPFAAVPNSEIVGTWACDGQTEYYHYSSPDEVLERGKKSIRAEAGKVYFPPNFVMRTECLWDGTFIVAHQQDPVVQDPNNDSNWRTVSAWVVSEEPSLLLSGKGPFHWGLPSTFPHIITFLFKDAPPKRTHGVLAGRPVEVETYHLKYPEGGWLQFEVSYDPSIGYLPRFARLISVGAREAIVREMYLAREHACKAGGFIPMEWYSRVLWIDDFRESEKSYDEHTVLEPRKPSHGRHFSITKLSDRARDVALTDVRNVHTLAGIGGAVPLPIRTATLSMSDIRSLLGDRLNKNTRPLLPNIDISEVNEFNTGPSLWPIWLICLAIACSVTIAVVWRRRRARRLLCFLPVTLLIVGCSSSAEPVVKLSAAFKDTYILTQPNATTTMALYLRNDGNHRVRIERIDGGCACRRVDQRSLPRTIEPGQQFMFSVEMVSNQVTMRRDARFNLTTDKGEIDVAVPYFEMVEHEFEPTSLSCGTLSEDSEWSFTFAHRAIHKTGTVPPRFTPRFPPEFQAVKTASESGAVAESAGYEYSLTKYEVQLVDRSLGLHKAIIALDDEGAPVLPKAPVLWNRLPFLSTTPAQVFLGTRPIRVFLRCPDESVELLRVLKAPVGVKAVVASPRELTVTVDTDAPPIIKGAIEVGTSSTSRGPLVVPVVRYAPVSHGTTESKPGP